jgi:hypothetical protein
VFAFNQKALHTRITPEIFYAFKYVMDNRSVTLPDNQPPVADRFSVYPNPSNGFFQIQVPKEWCPDVQLQIFDVTGRLVSSRAIKEIVTTININSFSSGIYILKLYYKNIIIVRKLNKQ